MDDAFSRDELAALLLAVEPVRPAPESVARVRARLRKRLQMDPGHARPAAKPFAALMREQGWRPFAGGTQMKVLHDDGRMMSWLVQMPPGTCLPAHRHDEGIEECLVLEGEVIVNDERYRAGDYVLAPQGSEHYDVRSDAGALFFLRSPSMRPGGTRAIAR